MREMNKLNLVQAGKIEKIWNEETWADEHPRIRAKESISELGKRGTLYLKFLTGKNAGLSRKVLSYPHGLYPEPKFPHPYNVHDEYEFYKSNGNTPPEKSPNPRE